MNNFTKYARFAAFCLTSLSLAACGAVTPGGSQASSQAQSSSSSTTPAPSSSVSSSASTPTVSSSVEEVSSSEAIAKVKVTFDYNYEGAPANQVLDIEKGNKVAEPTDPTRAGFDFLGWRIAKDSYQLYNFDLAVNADMTLYAGWGEVGMGKQKEYVFEAEYCPCITEGNNGMGMQGSTYSGGTSGKGLIQEDYGGAAQASNGFYVHFLYTKGNTLEFVIKSDVAKKASIYMRLSGEYRMEFTINPEKYPIKVNDVSMPYGDITIDKIPPWGEGYRVFEDYLLTAEVELVPGDNTIQMITDNEELMHGTAASTAPMVDCLKFYTSANLTWPSEKQSNISYDDE